ncbi:MAG: hypothetical protein KF724_12860 [Phycisphaeraceae bacterium]|nr:hypothetical protein [Phycisphaeraceae bacterium]
MDTNEPKRHSKPKPRSRAAETREVDHLRRQRLARMVELAQSYLGCSKAQLALTLNRDPAKVVPDSGNPKLDMVMGLSDVLDWPAGDVAEALWLDPIDDATEQEPVPEKPFAELSAESLQAHRDGDHARLHQLAAQMLRVATTPREKAQSANRLAAAFDLVGRYAKRLEWARVAASVSGLPRPVRWIYLANLANANYTMWSLEEAIALSTSVFDQASAMTDADDLTEYAKGLAGYVSGSARRRLLAEMPDLRNEHGDTALEHLMASSATLDALALKRNDVSYSGVANTCVGAAIEVKVLLGRLDPEQAAEQILAGVATVVDPTQRPRGDWLESWGWWSVFGLNIVLRMPPGQDRDRYAAVFSTKAHEIADRLGNWALRERVFSLEHDWRVSISQPREGSLEPKVLDREDLRNLLGTMGRFPWFRRVGWQILNSARLV